LEDDALRAFRGVLGHFHVQTNKIDPGPAFDWEGVAARVRKMREEEGEDDR
jgi:N-acetyl-anhydromuramyl-L-alanine amidase AmpD